MNVYKIYIGPIYANPHVEDEKKKKNLLTKRTLSKMYQF